MTDMSADQPDLWSFMIEFYSRPGVAEACLRLQEAHKVDVSLFLAVLRAVDMGRAVDADRARAMDARCAEWRETVIRPLRSIRMAMKAQSRMTDEMQGWKLREKVKAVELRSEQLEIHLLERLIADLPASDSSDRLRDMTLAARLVLENSGSGVAEPLPMEAKLIVEILAAL